MFCDVTRCHRALCHQPRNAVTPEPDATRSIKTMWVPRGVSRALTGALPTPPALHQEPPRLLLDRACEAPEGVGCCRRGRDSQGMSLMSRSLTHALSEAPKLKATKLPQSKATRGGPGGGDAGSRVRGLTDFPNYRGFNIYRAGVRGLRGRGSACTTVGGWVVWALMGMGYTEQARSCLHPGAWLARGTGLALVSPRGAAATH